LVAGSIPARGICIYASTGKKEFIFNDETVTTI